MAKTLDRVQNPRSPERVKFYRKQASRKSWRAKPVDA